MKYITKLLFVITLLLIVIYIPKVYAMQVSIKKTDGISIPLEVESSDTIEAVKTKIYEKDNSVPVERFKLIYNEKVLEDGRTIADYEITINSIIELEYIDDSKEDTPPIIEENPKTSNNSIRNIIIMVIVIIGTILSILHFNKKLNYEK